MAPRGYTKDATNEKLDESVRTFMSTLLSDGATIVRSSLADGIIGLIAAEDLSITLLRVEIADILMLAPAVQFSAEELRSATNVLFRCGCQVSNIQDDRRKLTTFASRESQREADQAALQLILARNGLGGA